MKRPQNYWYNRNIFNLKKRLQYLSKCCSFFFITQLIWKVDDERWIKADIYAEKYFNAFPSLLDSIKPTYSPLEIYATNCYSLRTFKRFLNHFGLIKIHTQGFGFEGKTYITKTDLYDKLIKCVPHKIFSTPTYLTSLN